MQEDARKTRPEPGTYGVIFDMDGVISDTQNLHAEIESRLFREHGITLTPEEITARFAGYGDKKMFSEVFAEYGLPEDRLDQIVAEKWKLMAKSVTNNGLQAVPYAIELIRILKESNFVLSIASGSPASFIASVIKILQLEQQFHYVISGEEVPEGKPAPDIFIQSAAGMNLMPRACLVIEDGINGMLAAAAAQMKCIGLVNDTGKSYPATRIVTSLREINPQLVLSMLESRS